VLSLAAAIGFAGAAIYLGLAQFMSGPAAALGTAGSALATAFSALAYVRLVTRLRNKPDQRFDGTTLAAELGSLLGKEATSFAASHARGTALSALLAGFAVGANPALRRSLRLLLKM